jgi:ABC-type polysaccharide/polyol phosphate transport system ATPase subunit
MAVIQFESVSRRFTIQGDKHRSLQEALIDLTHWRRKPRGEEFWAVKDVSFTVGNGESIALIGANGSGKSTVLKLIAQILRPTHGSVTVSKRVAALLELGSGFHPDLTGRENIYLNGSILGIERRRIHRELDRIVSFAGLERFIDTPVRNYSSGMQMRLGFSVATAFQPEVLLIDEVLAVGDQTFQSRCLDRIESIQTQGATIVLVSHDLEAVRRLCSRALWLENGHMLADGDAGAVVNQYLARTWSTEQEQLGDEPIVSADSENTDETAGVTRWGSGEARIESVELRGADGAPTSVFHTGEYFSVRMWYRAEQPVDRPAFGISIYDDQGNRINGPNTIWANVPIDCIHGRGYVDYVVEHLPLLAQRYELTVAIYDHHVAQPYDHWHRMMSFVVVPGSHEKQDGTIYIPSRWVYSAQTESPVAWESLAPAVVPDWIAEGR